MSYNVSRPAVVGLLSVVLSSGAFAAPSPTIIIGAPPPALEALSLNDAKGATIGDLVAPDAVLFNADGDWILLGVGRHGFTPSYKGAWSYLYAASNCTGTKYILSGDELASPTVAVNGLAPRANAVLDYAGAPFTKERIRSAQSAFPTASTCGPWSGSDAPVWVGVAKTVDLAKFKFAAPFVIGRGSGEVTPFAGVRSK